MTEVLHLHRYSFNMCVKDGGQKISTVRQYRTKKKRTIYLKKYFVNSTLFTVLFVNYL